jgi:hypothetical protein
MDKKQLILITLLLFILHYGIELKSMSSNAQQAQSDLWKSLHGKVVTNDGMGLPGVKITLKLDVAGSITTVTDDEGNFRFNQLPIGNYSIEFSLEGFKSVKRSIYVERTTKFDLTMNLCSIDETGRGGGGEGNIITLPNYGIELKSMSSNAQQAQSDLRKSLYGKVLTKDGRGLPYVTITATNPKMVGSTVAITDENGNFRFNQLPIGDYSIEFSLEGFTSVRRSIYVAKTTKFDLTMNSCSIDETGGIDVGGIDETGGGGGGGGNTITSPVEVPIPVRKAPIHKTTIFTDSGLNQLVSLLVQNDEKIHYSFYFSNGKIYAKSGIAETGSIRKKLNDITEIPKTSDYKYNGIKVKEEYVYTIRIAINDYYRIIILRVLNIYEKKVKIEYYIVPR